MSSTTTTSYRSLGDNPTLLTCSAPIDAETRAALGNIFPTIISTAFMVEPTAEDLARADVIFGFLPKTLQSVKQAPKLKLVQLMSAGADHAVVSPMWKEKEAEAIGLATSAGIHVGSIPQYVIAVLLSLYHRLQHQFIIGQVEKRWGNFKEIAGEQLLFIEEVRGKTVGVLGYGHIGRESARLAAAFGARIIAANSSGERKPQEGYIVPGTGDLDGSLPSAWYSTKDPESLKEFLATSDVVLVSLPSTPATKHMLNSTTLGYLKSSAILINVGRGDLIETSALVSALDEGKLAGAALDVTDPEPLPEGHTLFGRKNVIITPHTSALTVRYPELSLDVFLKNLERWEKGEELINKVDHTRGY